KIHNKKIDVWPTHLNLPLKESFLSALNIFAKAPLLPTPKKPSSKKNVPVLEQRYPESPCNSSQSPIMCPVCGRSYKLKSSLRNHMKWECGKEPQFLCPYCSYKAKQKMHVTRHIERMHQEIDYSAIRQKSASSPTKKVNKE
ncbi:hypothetical protein HHI36_020001, partial [Cryptolaemus montrouzieri]